jgi:hypothetical protein
MMVLRAGGQGRDEGGSKPSLGRLSRALWTETLYIIYNSVQDQELSVLKVMKALPKQIEQYASEEVFMYTAQYIFVLTS